IQKTNSPKPGHPDLYRQDKSAYAITSSVFLFTPETSQPGHMSRKLISDISASTMQVILNQSLGLVIFFITSRYLDKAVYGELNWSLAVLTFVTTILSLRLEQIVVRKVAAGADASGILTLFTGHVFFTGLGFYVLLALG